MKENKHNIDKSNHLIPAIIYLIGSVLTFYRAFEYYKKANADYGPIFIFALSGIFLILLFIRHLNKFLKKLRKEKNINS